MVALVLLTVLTVDMSTPRNLSKVRMGTQSLSVNVLAPLGPIHYMQNIVCPHNALHYSLVPIAMQPLYMY